MQHWEGTVAGFESSVTMPMVVVPKHEMEYLINCSNDIIAIDLTAALPQGIIILIILKDDQLKLTLDVQFITMMKDTYTSAIVLNGIMYLF